MKHIQTAASFAVVTTALVIGLIGLPDAAAAHIIRGAQGGFSSGFEHPLTGPDHFLAMFAVGLWGAQMGGRQVWTLPITFPLIMVIGGIIGIAGLPLPAVEIGIALSIMALGLAIALAWRPAEWIALILIAWLRTRCRTAAVGRSGRLRHRLCAGDRHDPSPRHRCRSRAQQAGRRPSLAWAWGADRPLWNLLPCSRSPRSLTRAPAS
jgi:hypothetical protein